MNHIVLCAAAFVLAGSAALAQQGNAGAHFLENWDLDGDGQVTLAEATERRDDVFSAFDADEDGRLAGNEYDLFDQARANDMQQNGAGHGQGYGAAGSGMERGFNDIDGDGIVSHAEFVGKTADWLAMLDGNGDGVVTTDDFGRR
ncbi:MAG: EF-hand domain-containing protein [Pseudorhodobacter sp.]|nr:EF-hand domain-containing protein [Pseudorhodobacter sp.]